MNLKIGLFIILTFLLSSCGNYLKQKKALASFDQTQQEILSSDFQSVKEVVFSPRCIECHSQYESYSAVKREIQAIRISVEAGRMPKTGGPLSESQKNILYAWIDRGAPESAGETPVAQEPETMTPDWKSISENIITPKCLVCHNPSGQAAFLDLTSRQSLFENRNRVFGSGLKLLDFENPDNSYLLQVITDPDEPMPPVFSNISRLNEEEVSMIREWIRLGLP